MGKYWEQPKREQIAVDDTHALMTDVEFKMLAVYSSSIPNGVYPGKMWKAFNGGKWWLRWFGEHPTDPGLCTNNHREIIIC